MTTAEKDLAVIQGTRSAFPSGQYCTAGMTLREYFSIKVYASMLGNYMEMPEDTAADAAYAVRAADALIEALISSADTPA
jgi:hypothetical protein